MRWQGRSGPSEALLVTAILVTMSRARSEEEEQRHQRLQEKGQGQESGRAQVPLWRDQQEEEGFLGECVRVCVRVHICVVGGRTFLSECLCVCMCEYVWGEMVPQ